MDIKICTKCGLEKDEKELGWERRGKRHACCKPCRVQDRMDYFKETRKKNWKTNGIVRLQNVRKPVYMFLPL